MTQPDEVTQFMLSLGFKLDKFDWGDEYWHSSMDATVSPQAAAFFHSHLTKELTKRSTIPTAADELTAENQRIRLYEDLTPKAKRLGVPLEYLEFVVDYCDEELAKREDKTRLDELHRFDAMLAHPKTTLDGVRFIFADRIAALTHKDKEDQN